MVKEKLKDAPEVIKAAIERWEKELDKGFLKGDLKAMKKEFQADVKAVNKFLGVVDVLAA